VFILEESVMQAGLRAAVRLERFQPDEIAPYLEHGRDDVPSWTAAAEERGWIVRDDRIMADPPLYVVADVGRDARAA
jgi:hypothetical protein